MVGLPLPGPARTCPHQPPLPERNSSSSSCCRFPLSNLTLSLPCAFPPQLGGTEVAQHGGVLAFRVRCTPTREYLILQENLPSFNSGTYPPPAKLLNFPAELGAGALLPLPALPSFPWNLDRALDLALGPATGAGRDPQRADLGHSHPRIKKLLPPFLESSCSPESRPSGHSPLSSPVLPVLPVCVCLCLSTRPVAATRLRSKQKLQPSSCSCLLSPPLPPFQNRVSQPVRPFPPNPNPPPPAANPRTPSTLVATWANCWLVRLEFFCNTNQSTRFQLPIQSNRGQPSPARLFIQSNWSIAAASHLISSHRISQLQRRAPASASQSPCPCRIASHRITRTTPRARPPATY